jgi:hypothetical protein
MAKPKTPEAVNTKTPKPSMRLEGKYIDKYLPDFGKMNLDDKMELTVSVRVTGLHNGYDWDNKPHRYVELEITGVEDEEPEEDGKPKETVDDRVKKFGQKSSPSAKKL